MAHPNPGDGRSQHLGVERPEITAKVIPVREAQERDAAALLELTVRVDNHRARRLYERAGYEKEGVRRASLLVDGEPVDELTLARLIR